MGKTILMFLAFAFSRRPATFSDPAWSKMESPIWGEVRYILHIHRGKVHLNTFNSLLEGEGHATADDQGVNL
jgi:hypothetical protein